MPEFVATATGLLPWPDDATDPGGTADPGGTPDADGRLDSDGSTGDDTLDTARTRLLDAQAAAGLDRIVESQLGWTDLLAHPLSVHGATEPGESRPYFDTGRTYRTPVVTGELPPDGTVATELSAVAGRLDRPLAAVLPGPYTLASLAADGRDGDGPALLDAVATFLAGEVEWFPVVRTLLLLEPSLAAIPPDDDADDVSRAARAAPSGPVSGPERAGDAVDRVARAADAEVVCHVTRGVLDERTHAFLLDAALDAVGYDLVADHDACRYLINEYGTADDVAVGVIDGRNPAVESPETVTDRIAWFLSNTPVADFGTVYATLSAEPVGLPFGAVGAKLDALAAGVQDVGTG